MVVRAVAAVSSWSTAGVSEHPNDEQRARKSTADRDWQPGVFDTVGAETVAAVRGVDTPRARARLGAGSLPLLNRPLGCSPEVFPWLIVA